MTSLRRTPQLRDRRFARVRRVTQSVFVGSGAVAALLAGFVAANPHATTTSVVTPKASSTPATTTTAPASSSASSTQQKSPTTTVAPAPTTTTTVCTSTPSGVVTCY